MASIRVEIDIEDHLSEVGTSYLSRELKERFRTGDKIDAEVVSALFLEDDRLGEALACWKRGNAEDALHHLEIILGPDWWGLSEIMRRRVA